MAPFPAIPQPATATPVPASSSFSNIPPSAMVLTTLINRPMVPHLSKSPLTPLGSSPNLSLRCPLCEKPIGPTAVYYHKDERTGVDEKYCLLCHVIWLNLDYELAQESQPEPNKVIDLVNSSSPHQQRHATAHSSFHVNHRIIEIMDSPSPPDADPPAPLDAFSNIQQVCTQLGPTLTLQSKWISI